MLDARPARGAPPALTCKSRLPANTEWVGRGLRIGLALACLLVAACVGVPVAAAAGPGLSATPAGTTPGGAVQVSWSGIASPSSTDWIGLFRQGAADGQSVRWFYTATCSSSTGAPKASGTCALTMPSTPATYELRLFARNGYSRLATFGPLSVTGSGSSSPTLAASPSTVAPGGSVSVAWNGVTAPSTTDWVGLYRQGAADTAAVRWFYTSTCTSAAGTAKGWGSCPATMPSTAATYEFRLFARNGYTRLATSAPVTVGTAPPASGDPVLMAVGDIAACTTQGDEATAALVAQYPNAAVATIGDHAYPHGAAADFQNCYEPSWGRFKSRTHPAPGNHDYDTPGASGYYGYFGSAAGDPRKGYYSYDIGTWHVVVLNSNCSEIGGCGAGSAQEQWLRGDLAANAAPCTLAYWHHPLYSSADVGNDPEMAAIWNALQARGADVVLNGHAHVYERFAPQTSSGVADPSAPRQFIVGTGGDELHSLGARAPNSVVLDDNTLGVLKLTLHAGSYDWEFLPVAGRTFTDSGTAACHPAGAAPAAPALAAPGAATAGGTLTVSWSGVAAATSTDWVGLYRQGAPDTAAVRWFYTATCTSSTGTARAAGSCTIPVPSTRGTYELRLFKQNGYTRLATSGPVAVT